MINFKCYEVIWSVDENRLKRVRFSVFIEEQGVAQEEEWDEEDINSRHFLAVDDAGRPIGTARLTPNGQIGRMAVVKELRGNGIGKTLLKLAINGAK
ncbi:MAG TPA: GNAT family N-acetyltransferase, partial [Gammaproteobacteria bacterium]|nr:GNAT family N-acetyltransferase [Gammaproteobacteria bacterium]